MNRYCFSIATMVSGLIVGLIPAIVQAQPLEYHDRLVAQISIGGQSSTTTTTTIVTPSIVTETTTAPVFIYGNNGTSVVTEYYSPFRRRPSIYRHHQPTVIWQQNIIYPRDTGRNCTTTVIGSPIPNPVALDSRTGQFCN